MPLAEGTDDELWTEFLRRFDVALFRLQRDHPWARRTLRNLAPFPGHGAGALGVDKWLRMYVNTRYVLGMWTQEQLTTAIWHECHHLLRNHEARLGSDGHDHHLANVAADLEINYDLAQQGAVLPPDILNHENQGMTGFEGHEAESMYAELVGRKEEEKFKGPKQPSDDQDSEPSDDDDEDGVPFQQEGGKSDPSAEPPESDEEEREDGGEDGSPQEDEGEQSQGSQAPQEQSGDSDDEPVTPMGCGSGAGGDQLEEELGEPEQEDQARVEREMRRQAEEVVSEVERHGHSDTTEEVYKVSLDKLDTSEIDWRQEIAPYIRQSFEQVMDDAEEYTFKHRSRRQAAVDDVLLPGSFRPTPKLAVVVDVSGSMDFGKLKLALQEVHGIMDRLAIPTFMAIPFCTGPMREFPIQVHSSADIMEVMEDVGGGTDMLEGIEYAVDVCGAEIVVVLTDADCEWDPWPWAQRNVPVIIGGVRVSPHIRPTLPDVPYVEVKE